MKQGCIYQFSQLMHRKQKFKTNIFVIILSSWLLASQHIFMGWKDYWIFIFNLECLCIVLAGKEVLKDEQFLETIIQGVFIILIIYAIEKTSNCKVKYKNYIPCFLERIVLNLAWTLFRLSVFILCVCLHHLISLSIPIGFDLTTVLFVSFYGPEYLLRHRVVCINI